VPEDGLNPMQRGSLLHTLLEKTLIKLQDQGIRLSEENMDSVMAALDASCEEVYPSAHLRYGFQPTPLWTYEQQELMRMLIVYLTWECLENKGRFFPYLQEAKFGIPDHEPEAYLSGLRGETFSFAVSLIGSIKMIMGTCWLSITKAAAPNLLKKTSKKV
jgi:hypothetical protein